MADLPVAAMLEDGDGRPDQLDGELPAARANGAMPNGTALERGSAPQIGNDYPAFCGICSK